MIKVSSRGEYGVRVMVELGRRYGQGPASLTDISLEASLPLDYLEHLIIPLRNAGLVRSTRGKRGGYALARPPQDIVMGEVVRLLEGPIVPQICASECDRTPEQFCELESFCTTKILWLRVRDSIAHALDSTTLADLLPKTAQPRNRITTGVRSYGPRRARVTTRKGQAFAAVEAVSATS